MAHRELCLHHVGGIAGALRLPLRVTRTGWIVILRKDLSSLLIADKNRDTKNTVGSVGV